MANLNHLEKIKLGVSFWNEWKSNCSEDIDLRGVDLREADLSEIDLCRADLTEADLSEANLSKANLRGANLKDAKIILAYLFRTNLNQADLSGADLSGADLNKTKLTGTNLDGVKLIDVFLGNTNFKNAKNHPKWLLKGLNNDGIFSIKNLINNIKIGFKKLRGAVLKKTDLSGINLSRGDLSETDLSGMNLTKADLRKADLRKADLNGINLTEANLSGANLSGANLRRAILRGSTFDKTNLIDAINLPEWIIMGLNDMGMYSQKQLVNKIKKGFRNLSEADLSGSNLSGTNLSGADLNGANLSRANLRGTFLNRAILREADLKGADLSGTDLRNADLSNADLRYAKTIITYFNKANLSGANLSGIDLSRIDLSEADLSGTDLSEARLINTNLTNACITAVNLYGTARDDWVIDGVKCDYFYNDKNRKIRHPKKNNFKKREFEELYKTLPTFEYIFENAFTPIDAFLMDQVVQAINEQRPEIDLRLDSFHSRGYQPRAIFTVFHNDYKDEALKKVTYEYEKKIVALEGKNEVLKEIVISAINKPQQLIKGNKIIIGDKKMGDNININSNGNLAFGTGNATVNQKNIEYEANYELLTEIKRLKYELSKLTINQTNREAIDIQLETLENCAKSNNKNTVLLKSTLESIKAITQGALGNAMGAGMIEAFKRVGLMII